MSEPSPAKVICHRCREERLRQECSLHWIWEGVIQAKKIERLFCFDCLADLRREHEENNQLERDGEDWKTNYDPDRNTGDEWKNQ